MNNYTVEVEKTEAQLGCMFVAIIRRINDVTLYIIGPAYSEAELLQKTLARFGRK
jgi:hypothetical protein